MYVCFCMEFCLVFGAMPLAIIQIIFNSIVHSSFFPPFKGEGVTTHFAIKPHRPVLLAICGGFMNPYCAICAIDSHSTFTHIYHRENITSYSVCSPEKCGKMKAVLIKINWKGDQMLFVPRIEFIWAIFSLPHLQTENEPHFAVCNFDGIKKNILATALSRTRTQFQFIQRENN